MSSGFIFKEDPPVTSFNQFNPRIRDLFVNEEDWDYELGLLNEINDNNEFQDEDEEMADELYRELDFENTLANRQLNFN